MRKFKLLLSVMLSAMAWTGTMAQTNAEYEAAIAAIQDKGDYFVKSNVGGTDYYLKGNGTLTSNKDEAAIYTFQKVSSNGGYKEYGFKLNNYGTFFSNPPGTSESNLASGKINTSARADNNQYEAQVFFLKDGKYAVRAGNTPTATSGWAWVAGSYWTVIGDVDPIAQYQWAANYCWELEGPLTTANVTYKLVEYDGTTVVSSTTKKQEANSDLSTTAIHSLTGLDFNGFWHEKFYFDYDISGTIGDTDCTITITRTEKAGLVKALSDLSNTKAYNIACDRGAMIAYNGSMCSTALNDAAANAKPYGKFALLNYEDNYYIFSVDENKFIKNDASVALDLTEVGFSTDDAIKLDPKTAPYFLLYFTKKEDNNGLNTNGNNPLGYVINTWMNADQGNQYYIVEAEDFDPTAALAELDAYFHPAYFVTYKIKDTFGNVIFTSEPQPTKAGAKITTLLPDFQRPFYTYSEEDVTITEQNTTVEFTATWNGPFKISTDFANAQWQNMAMRSTWYVTSAIKDDSGAYKTQNANTMGLVEDSYQWAFIGNGYDGFKIINKAEGDGKSLGWTNDNQKDAGIPTIMADNEGNHAWKVVASTNTSVPAGSFCLNVAGTSLYINQYGGVKTVNGVQEGGSLKFWNATGNIADAGSAFTVFDVPTNFASFVTDEIAPYMEVTGYFSLTDAAKATIGYDESKKTECSFVDYKSMKEKLTADFLSNISNYVLPETGYYILKNKDYGTYMGIDPSDANMYGNYKTANLAKNVVKLTKTGDATYTISLMDKYAPATVAQSVSVTASTEAGTYTVVIPTPGYAAFQADPSANMSCLHCRAAGDIVGWEAPAEASKWSVTDAESIQLTIGSEGYATAYLPFPVEFGGLLPVPEAKGVWTFDDPDNLLAGTGVATIQATTHEQNSVTVATPATANITAVDGPATGNGAVEVPVGSSLLMTANTGATSIGTYTIMWDVCADDASTYIPLLQNNLNNAKDGSFFINKNAVGHGGDVGYNGKIQDGEWNRVVFVVEPYGASVYLNGEFLASKYGLTANNQSYYTHWLLSTGALFFADEDGEEKTIKASEIRFWDEALTQAQVAKLATVGTAIETNTPDDYNVTAYTAQYKDTWLELNKLDGTIPTKTPVILKGAPETYVYNIVAEAPAVSGNVLQGTLEEITADGSQYILAKPAGEAVGFYQATTGSIKPGKAYLTPGTVSVKAFYFYNEDATGIKNIENTTKNIQYSNDAIYNLSGQRINKLQKGINIVNGKKILK